MEKKDFSFKELFESPAKRRARQEPWYYQLLLFLVIFISLMSLVFVGLQASYANGQLKKIKELEENLSTVSDSLKSDLLEIKRATVEVEAVKDDKKDEEKSDENIVGRIEGSLSYPSQFIPKDMKVCAENLETKETICTEEQLSDKRFSFGVGYSLTLPVGTYHVFATTALWPAYKSYYNEFVTCGLKAGCPSRKNIDVVIEKDSSLKDIDPIDWYDVES